MLYNRVLIVILLWATSCSSFQLKSRIQIINKFQTNSKSHNVLMTSAPSILSLDKVVIPYYWDRTRVLSKFGLFLAVTWIISVILKPKIDYEFVLNFLEEKKQIANTVMTKLLAKTDDIVSFVRNRFTNLDLSSWRQFSLKKVVPINSSYSLCQFSAGLFGRLENVDIGQEVWNLYNFSIYI